MSNDRDGRKSEAAPESPEARPRRVVSLLGQRGDQAEPPPAGERGDHAPDERARERPGRGAASGPDPLRSAHSTFRDLEAPRDDFDPARSRGVCAEIARQALRDFAPALVLLPAASRVRAQAVVAYARTLLDFARDRTLEGERLAQINRFEFALEAALGGEPPGQPVFVQLATLEREAAWPRQAFDDFASIARSRITVGLPANERTASTQRLRLARAALHALHGVAPAPELAALGAAVLRAASLLAWHDALWFHRPDLGLGQDDAPSAAFRRVIAGEERAVQAALAASRAAVAELPDRLRPAARYAASAARALVRRATLHPDTASPPRLPAGLRLWLLLRARL